MNELNEKIKDLQKQVCDISNLLKELEDKLEVSTASGEIPEVPTFNAGEDILYLSDTGEIVTGEVISRERDPELGDFNLFHSENFAKEYQRKIKEIGALLHCKWYLDRDYVPDWSYGEFKFTVAFVPEENAFYPVSTGSTEYSSIYFMSAEKAQKAADWMNAHKELFE